MKQKKSIENGRGKSIDDDMSKKIRKYEYKMSIYKMIISAYTHILNIHA